MSPFRCRLGVELIEGRIVPSSVVGSDHLTEVSSTTSAAADVRTQDDSSAIQQDQRNQTPANTTSPADQWRVPVAQNLTLAPQVTVGGNPPAANTDPLSTSGTAVRPAVVTPSAIHAGVRPEQTFPGVSWREPPGGPLGERSRPAEPFVLLGVAVRGPGESGRPPGSLWWSGKAEMPTTPPAPVPSAPVRPAEAVPPPVPGPTTSPNDLLPPLAALPGVAPVAGLLGVDVDALDAGVRGLLDHAAALATGPADEDGAAGWWLWASTAAVVAGGAGYAVWSVQAARRPGRSFAKTPWGDGYGRRLG